jgi:hypothetical protein
VIKAISEAGIAAYLSPGAQDQRDAMLARQLNRFSRGVEVRGALIALSSG